MAICSLCSYLNTGGYKTASSVINVDRDICTDAISKFCVSLSPVFEAVQPIPQAENSSLSKALASEFVIR
jgi:hypothetical protein